ncbi:MAG: TCR/Tet family MFS transporter [Rhodobacteraceae bacterium]|nr:TCR/Tet family MFS transporter [Paracoccaceae bacterium]
MKNKLSLIFVLTTVAIDSIGIGIIIPVMPDLIREVSGGSLADAAVWAGVLTASYSFMQFLCSPTVGSLSDRFGRRPVLLISLLFMSIDYLIMGIAHTVFLLLLGRILGGITASTPATVGAYIADISQPEEKAKNFGLIGAAFGVGFVLGPLLGAVFAEFGTRAPFFAAAFIAFINLLFGYFVLPETVTDKIRRKFEWKRANPVGGLLYLAQLPNLKLLIIIYFIFQLAFTVYPVLFSFFTVERFGWDPKLIGISLAGYGILIAIVQGGLIRIVLNYLTERQTMLVGFIFEIIGFIGYGFIDKTWMVFALMPIGSLGSLAIPAHQGLMSRMVGVDQQGELQGILTSLTSLVYIISPLVMTGLFYVFINPDFPIYLPGAPFLFSALIGIVCFILVYRLKETLYRQSGRKNLRA